MAKPRKTNKTESSDSAAPDALAGHLAFCQSAPIVETDDLAVLGQVSTALEAIRDGQTPDTPFHDLSVTAVDLCDRIILAEGPGAQAGRELLVRCVEQLRALNDAPEDEAARSEAGRLADEAARFDPDAPPDAAEGSAGSETGEGTLANAIESVPLPAPDKVTLADEEDVIVYREFVTESLEHIEVLEVQVIELEKDPGDTDIINGIFRPIHSIKGAAGFLGLSTTNMLCHELETLLDKGRKLSLVIDQQVIDVILASIDVVKRLIHNLSHLIEAAVQKGPEPDLHPVDIRPQILAIRAILEQPAAKPSASDDGPDPNRIGGRLLSQGLVSQSDLSAALAEQQRPLGQILVDKGAVAQDAVEAAARSAPAGGGRGASAIKIDASRLDSLMEMVGELVIAQSQVEQDTFFRQNASQALSRTLGDLSKITRNLQDMVMSIRMVPLRQTFQRMFRLVRDTAQKTGKQAQLVLTGEDTEIDKTVIDEIADPLVHLLRNAVDHGIDPPEERTKAGKDPQGRIDLRAYHHGGNVVIEVEDDGRGLNRDRILQKAVERGIASTDRDYSEAEIFAFVLAPGFSTADKATDISGRGVGMDVVKRNIERLGGRVEIRSSEGEGSTFTIRLPLTMAIVDGMVVGIGTNRYVVPTLSIEESVRPESEMVSTVRGKGEMVLVRNELIPLLRLERVFDGDATDGNPWDKLVLVISAEGRRIGLLVDELMGQQQVVIKNLGERLRGIRGVSGGCILGDGRVALIVDVAKLVEMAENG